jgi:glycosyltransferase involved in cell wall biosynthesis
MTAPLLIIVQPWFTARGHPAQSLLNTARVIGRRSDISYVISRDGVRTDLESMIQDLRRFGQVHEFHVSKPRLSTGTVLGALHAVRIARRRHAEVDVFFLDAHLPALAAVRPLLRALAPQVRNISALGLVGPEATIKPIWRRALLKDFVSSKRTKMFLRTEELAEAWRRALDVKPQGKVDTLPSLEIPERILEEVVERSGPTRFGVVGQVRTGKGLEWLVPLFTQHPELGVLSVEGALYNEQNTSLRTLLENFSGFRNVFIPEDELVPTAAYYDYLLTLYDKWDHRLEAATFYLAARAARPVICFDLGWCARIVREFGCGIVVPSAPVPGADFFAALPKRDSAQYRQLCDGMSRFHSAYRGSARVGEFLHKLRR